MEEIDEYPEEATIEIEDDYEFDEVRGIKHKKMAVLNKKDVSKEEIDELFNDYNDFYETYFSNT